MSEQQKQLLQDVCDSINRLDDDNAVIAAAKLSGFVEGVNAEKLRRESEASGIAEH